MKRCRFFLVTLSGLFVAPAWAQDVLKVCYEGEDVRPWRHKDGTGLNFELLSRAAKRAGVVFEFEATPWRRCFIEVQNGNLAGILGASFKTDRMTYAAYPGGATPDAKRSAYHDRYILIRRKGDRLDWDGKMFYNLVGPIGVQNGYSIGSDLKSLGVTIDDGGRSLADNIQKLLSGRISGVAGLAGEMNTLFAEESQLKNKLETLPVPLQEKPYYLMLSNQLVQTRPELAERVWAAIEAVRQSKEYRVLEQDALKKTR